MKTEFSEFSYGYAVTEQLISHMGGGLEAAPYCPSLIMEGKLDHGYDVMLKKGVPIFLQFKLSEFIARSSNRTKEVTDGILKPGMSFYRMHVRPERHSQQHKSLLNLEADGKHIFYAAPGFHTIRDFNGAYLDKLVLHRSAWIKPGLITPPSAAFTLDEITGRFTQQPAQSVDFTSFCESLDGVVKSTSVLWEESVESLRCVMEKAFFDYERGMMEIGVCDDMEVEPPSVMRVNCIREALRSNNPAIAAHIISQLARTLFGCELMFVSEQS